MTTVSQRAAAGTDLDCTRTQIDPRGPRFGGAITTVVLAAALILVGTPLGTLLVAWQTVVFALGAIVGLQAQPYGILFRKVIRPRLAPPPELEDAAPPRFAQAVGLGFLVVALIALATGATVVATVAIAFALAAAFLNAAFDFCLGCEMYLIGKRILHA
jgi:Domain of unknown function (DUF4395)